MITENEALCKILCHKTGSTKEKDCLDAVENFIKHKDFNKTVDELSKLLGKSKDEIMDIIGSSCIPCAQGES